MKPYYYKCTLIKVIDGDTIDVDIDLGFGVTLSNQRLRLYGINTPETRTRDLEEKRRGLIAKERVQELCEDELEILSHGKGKYGRILATPFNNNGVNICQQLLDEDLAVEYYGK
jgi:micrococcal nuclease